MFDKGWSFWRTNIKPVGNRYRLLEAACQSLEGLRCPLELRVLKSTPPALRRRFFSARVLPRSVRAGVAGIFVAGLVARLHDAFPASDPAWILDARSPRSAARKPIEEAEWRRSILAAIAALDPDDRRAQEDALAAAFPELPGWTRGRDRAALRLGLPRGDPHRADAGDGLRGGEASDPAPGGPARAHDCGCIAWSIPERARARRPGDSRAGRGPARGPGRFDRLGPRSPGVAFDELGYRLGRGAGHYDRLLPGDARRRRLLGLLPELPARPPAAGRAPRRPDGRDHHARIGPSWAGAVGRRSSADHPGRPG